MKEKLQAIMESALKQIEEAVDSEKLNDARVSFLGKKGELTQVLKSLKDVAPEDRPKVGQLVNEAREAIEKRLDERKKEFDKKMLDLRCYSSCQKAYDRA